MEQSRQSSSEHIKAKSYSQFVKQKEVEEKENYIKTIEGELEVLTKLLKEVEEKIINLTKMRKEGFFIPETETQRLRNRKTELKRELLKKQIELEKERNTLLQKDEKTQNTKHSKQQQTKTPKTKHEREQEQIARNREESKKIIMQNVRVIDITLHPTRYELEKQHKDKITNPRINGKTFGDIDSDKISLGFFNDYFEFENDEYIIAKVESAFVTDESLQVLSLSIEELYDNPPVFDSLINEIEEITKNLKLKKLEIMGIKKEQFKMLLSVNSYKESEKGFVKTFKINGI
jgi:hypothetical protein